MTNHEAIVKNVHAALDRLRIEPAERKGDGAIRDLLGDFLLAEPELLTCTIRMHRKGKVETLRNAEGENSGEIEVAIEDGVITLAGVVISVSHKRLAGVLAWWTPGCRDVINRLDLGNTLTSVILTYPTMLVPFCAWLLLGYFKTVPKELEEAARIDGASRVQTMWMIFLPLCTPGFISAGIFAFTLSQNEFLYALIFLTKTSVRTVPVGVISELIRGDVFYWGQLMAGALLGSIPVALIYSFFVEHYVAGLTAGSVKG